MQQPTRFVGMDVHKDTIVVAVTAMGDVGKATPYGTVPNTAAALEKLVRRLRQAGSGPLKFCYEAGPCGSYAGNWVTGDQAAFCVDVLMTSTPLVNVTPRRSLGN